MIAARTPENRIADALAVPKALERAAADTQQRHDLPVAQPYVRVGFLLLPFAVADISGYLIYLSTSSL